MPLPPNPRPPLALPGFEHIKRAWHDSFEAYSARLNPGEYYVTKNAEGIYTTLGSCISACIRDRVSGIGGMNHFMLPVSTGDGGWKAAGLGASTRYGNFAMEHLINEIMKNGGSRQNLEVKLFGGGRIIANMTDVGMRNIEFARDYVKTEGLRVTSEDVGDVFPRMVVYFPATGKVRVKRLRSLHNNTIAEQETKYLHTIEEKPVSGEIELF
ncbi:MAG: chemoreceptor glutamine deamidase CheD [Gallionellaceae bacterium]|nr:MAG: chemoreceptor glutamine deamidase CheD [Gallionellaceae bacterium]